MEWKPIKELNNLYYISEKGIVKKGKTGKEIKSFPNHRGYLRVLIMIKGKRYVLRVHRLVAKAFIPNPEKKPQVNHKNGIKTDNRVENLEWVSNEENYEHALKNNLVRKNIKPIAMFVNGEKQAIFKNICDAHRKTGMPYNSIYYSLTLSKRKFQKTKRVYWEYV